MPERQQDNEHFDESSRPVPAGKAAVQDSAELIPVEDPNILDTRIAAMRELSRRAQEVVEAKARVKQARSARYDALELVGGDEPLIAPEGSVFTFSGATLSPEDFKDFSEPALYHVYGWDEASHHPDGRDAGETTKFLGNMMMVSSDGQLPYLVNTQDHTCSPFRYGFDVALVPLSDDTPGDSEPTVYPAPPQA